MYQKIEDNPWTWADALNTTPQRAWINQPSTHQQHHNLHGVNVLTYPPVSRDTIRIYFLKGNVESQIINVGALSQGWKS